MDVTIVTGSPKLWKQFVIDELNRRLTYPQNNSWTSSSSDKLEKFFETDVESNGGKAADTPLDPEIITLLTDWACEEMSSQIPEHAGYASQGIDSVSDRVFDEDIIAYTETIGMEQRVSASGKKLERAAKKAAKKAENEKKKEEEREKKEQERVAAELEKLEKKKQETLEKAAKIQAQLQKKAQQMMADAISAATTAAEKMQELYGEALQQETQSRFSEEMNEWIKSERKKIENKLKKYIEELYNILVNAHKGRFDTLRAMNKQLERMICGIRKVVLSAKEDAEVKTKKLSDSINKQYLQKQQSAAAAAVKKSIKAALDEADRLIAEATTAADSAVQQLQGKIDALAGK